MKVVPFEPNREEKSSAVPVVPKELNRFVVVPPNRLLKSRVVPVPVVPNTDEKSNVGVVVVPNRLRPSDPVVPNKLNPVVPVVPVLNSEEKSSPVLVPVSVVVVPKRLVPVF